MIRTKPNSKGYLTLTALVFSGLFVLITTSLAGFLIAENQLTRRLVLKEEASHIAEAGLNYYRWYLSHNPDDLTNGTGTPGPITVDYEDPEGGVVGQFELNLTSNTACGSVLSVDIESTGSPSEDPSVKRTLKARYAKPTVADYSFILDSDVWAGSDRVINGAYHSNGGIRMDGTHNNIVSSARTTWTCTSSFGCSPNQTKDGVFGAGGGADWVFPATQIDFAGISTDIGQIKTLAQNSGRYFDTSSGYGYHVIINDNQTVTVYRVSGASNVTSYTTDGGWQNERELITNQVLVGTYAVPSDCPVLYFEDNLWVQGTVSGKMLIASARLGTSVDTDILIPDNITYKDGSETDGLVLVAERNVRIPINSPNNMEIDGVLVAKNGAYGRNHYDDYYLSSQYDGWNGRLRNSLILKGTVVSKGRVGTQWTSGGTTVSGYASRTAYSDELLANNPPPLTPATSDVFRFVKWEEEE